MPIDINNVLELTDAIVKTKYENNADTNAFTDAEQTKLTGIETAATADQTDAEIETAYNNQVAIVSQVNAEAGTSTTAYRWTPERVAQAIAALASAGAVDSVNTFTGAVVLDPDDLDDTSTTNKFTTAAEISKLAGIEAGATADQTASEVPVVDAGGNFTATNVETVLAEIAGMLGGKSYDSLTSGSVTAEVTRSGGTATTISTPGAGIYDLDIKAGADIEVITVFGDNGDLDGSNQFTLTIDNNANSRERRFNIQLHDANTGAVQDPHAIGCNWTQNVTANVTTILFPGMDAFGATGFYIELR